MPVPRTQTLDAGYLAAMGSLAPACPGLGTGLSLCSDGLPVSLGHWVRLEVRAPQSSWDMEGPECGGSVPSTASCGPLGGQPWPVLALSQTVQGAVSPALESPRCLSEVPHLGGAGWQGQGWSGRTRCPCPRGSGQPYLASPGERAQAGEAGVRSPGAQSPSGFCPWESLL